MDMWYTERHGKVGITLEVVETLVRRKTAFQEIAIVETAAFGRMLLLDGLVMTTERDEFIYHELISHVPLLALPQPPRQVLIIGGGDGGVVREVLRYPSVERVVLCEIDAAVIELSRQYLPAIAGQLGDPRVDIQVRDGVEFIAEQKNEFDVIIIDSTDPISIGEGLFTADFYRNVAAALTPHGVMVCQSESPLLDLELVVSIQNKLKQAFAIVTPYVAPIYTYPGGYWSWTMAAQTTEPLAQVDWAMAAEIEKETRYYNMAVHEAVFALPNYMRAALS